MGEERKEYSIIGRVEIGTDEYRDLIESLAGARADYLNANSKRWDESKRADKAEMALNEAEGKLQKINEFLKQDKDLFLRFQMWILGDDKDA